MKAMILAAGKGTRARPLTYSVPKPMIRLVRKPVMESIVEHLKRHGIEEIMVNTSHLADNIENYFGDGDRFGVRIGYSFEGEIVDGALKGKALGSAGGLRKIQDFAGFFDQSFIVLCGDALIDLDIEKAYEFHGRQKALATIILKEVDRREVYKYGVVQTDGNGRILRFQEKPAVEEALSTTVNTGIYIFEPGIFDYIPSGLEFDIGGDLFPRLVEDHAEFFGVSLPFQWVDIGSVPDYYAANAMILEEKIRGYQLPGREVRPRIHTGINIKADFDQINITGPVYIGSCTQIGDAVKIIGPAVIGSNCVIEDGAVIDRCILDDYIRVSPVACLEQKIIFGGKCIDPNGGVVDIEETDIGWLVDDSRKKEQCNEIHQLLEETLKSALHA